MDGLVRHSRETVGQTDRANVLTPPPPWSTRPAGRTEESNAALAENRRFTPGRYCQRADHSHASPPPPV
jgi:hypothetical protein